MTLALVLAFSWSLEIERVDDPAKSEWLRGETDSAETVVVKGEVLPISVRTEVTAAADGVKRAVATVVNATKDWRVRHFCARPYARKVPADYEALYFPSGLGLRYTRLPAEADGDEAVGWVRMKRADGERRYTLKASGIISPGLYPSWTTTMSFLTFTTKTGGVYWGCHDPEYVTKTPLPLYDPAARELAYEAMLEIQLDPGRTWTMAPVVETDYRGSWHAGAKLYRDWFRTTVPAPVRTPREMSGQLLCILKQQNGEIIWPYPELDRLAETAKAHGLDWIGLFGWAHGGHDHLYPEYNPDPLMGGRDALVAGIRAIHAKGLKCYLYANGQLQEHRATEFWEKTGQHCAIRKRTGELYTETWHKFKNAPAHTFNLGCLRSEAWFQQLLSLARQANDLGADGILYDQLGNTPPRACYDAGHGHPVGQMVFAEDKELFLRRLKGEMAKVNPAFIFMTEGLGDIFQDTFSFYHGMSAGAYPVFDGPNVLNRLRGIANPGADFWPELFRYTFPDVLSTCRNNNPYLPRTWVNYDAFFGLRHEIEIRYRPDRAYVESGKFPGKAAYDVILGPPQLEPMEQTDQRTAETYLKRVCAFQKTFSKYLLEGRFVDAEDSPVSGLPAKRYDAADGSFAVLAWNVGEKPVAPVFARRPSVAASPEGTVPEVAAPVPPDSLRLYLYSAKGLTEEGRAKVKYIFSGWDLGDVTPQEILAEADKFDRSGCDGVRISISGALPGHDARRPRYLMNDPGWKWDEVKHFVPVFREIVKHPSLGESMLSIHGAPTNRLDWADDAAWGRVAGSLRTLTRLAKEGGLKGLAFDFEDYWRKKQYDLVEGDPDYDTAYRLARERGRELFEKVFAEYPDAVILTFQLFTADVEYARSAADPRTLMREKGDLWPAFLNGLLDVMPPGVKLVDGNESFGYHAEASKNGFYRSVRDQLVKALPLVAPKNRAKYRAQVSTSFGIYLDSYCVPTNSAYYMGPVSGSRINHFEDNLRQATDCADEYIWFWGEKGFYIDWPADLKEKSGDRWRSSGCGTWRGKYFREGGPWGVIKPWSRTIDGGCDIDRVMIGVRDPVRCVTEEYAQQHEAGSFENLVKTPPKPKAIGHVHCRVSGLKTRGWYGARVKGRGEIVRGRAYFQYRGSWRWGLGEVVFVFGEPDADGWREGKALAAIPEGATDLFFILAGPKGDEKMKVEYSDFEVFRIR